MACFTMPVTYHLVSHWYLCGALFLLLALPVTSILVEEDVLPALITSEIPNNSVLCPGGYWSVAVTSFGLHRGAFGKAKPKVKGGVDAYFAYQGSERSILQGEDLDLLVFPTSGEREYKWVSVKEYNKRRKRYKAVRRGHCSPFAFFHPGDGALWQLGKIDLENDWALYTVEGKQVELGPEAMEEGRILVMSFKENTSTRIKRVMTIVLAVFLNILSVCFIYPFLPKRSSSKGSLRLLNEEIGAGGFGVVEKAMLGNSKVAVKFVNPLANCSSDAEGAITHELKMLERIPRHDNVVHCFGQFVDKDKRIGIVEELMDMSMYDWIYSDNFREETTMLKVLDVFIDISKGLEHLHTCGIVHYDLKPKNVLLDKHFAAKVADFGCSKIKANSYITAKLCGTMGYLAPECILSMFCNIKSRVRAEKIDVFSLGVVMWEALVGCGPHCMMGGVDLSFESSPPQDTTGRSGRKMQTISKSTESFNLSTGQFNNCLAAKFPTIKRCPEELRNLVTRCMDVSNRSRPTCRTIRRNLEGMRTAPWANSFICDVVG